MMLSCFAAFLFIVGILMLVLGLIDNVESKTSRSDIIALVGGVMVSAAFVTAVFLH